MCLHDLVGISCVTISIFIVNCQNQRRRFGGVSAVLQYFITVLFCHTFTFIKEIKLLAI